MDERDLPFVPYAQLSEKRQRLLKEMRPDLRPWQLRSVEVRFELDRNRVAVRSTAAVNREVTGLLRNLFPRPVPRLPENALSSCPTYLSLTGD